MFVTRSKVAYISQTTLSVDETRAIINRLRERFPAVIGPRTDDICYATTNRQAAVKQLARECELVLVIGSRNSSNSNRLVEVAREHGADSHLIDNEGQVREEWLTGKRVVGITSGASAPEELVQRLIDFFLARGTSDVQELEVVQEDVPLHAPQGDPPGSGGRPRIASRSRCTLWSSALAVSGCWNGGGRRDVPRRASDGVRERGAAGKVMVEVAVEPNGRAGGRCRLQMIPDAAGPTPREFIVATPSPARS